MFQLGLSSFLHLYAPVLCAACDYPVPSFRFCDACGPLLQPTENPRLEEAAFEYGGPLRDALIRFKYQKRTDLCETLGSAFANELKALKLNSEMVAYVPMHPRKYVERGFNPAALLAVEVGRHLKLPARDLLRREKDSDQSAGKTRTERDELVRDAFRCSARAKGKRVLLIDDVRTTGATFRAVEKELYSAGAESVVCVALCGVPSEELVPDGVLSLGALPKTMR